MPKFVTRNWIEVNDLSGDQYFVNKNIRFKTPILRSYLCDYGYIVAKGRISVTGTKNANRRNTKLTRMMHTKLQKWCSD